MMNRTFRVGCVALFLVSVSHGATVAPAEMKHADRFAKDRQASLAQMAEAAPVEGVITASQGWGALHCGWSVNHRVLQLHGTQYPTGFGSHANADIEYRLPAGAARLTGTCGIDDTEEARGTPNPVVFSVAVDGHTAWHGDTITALSLPGKFDIDVTGAKTVAFLARGVDDLTYCPADFVDLKLKMADGSVRELGRRVDSAAAIGSGISFIYGGRPSATFLGSWPLQTKTLPETVLYTASTFTRTDPATGLQCTVTLKTYKHFPVVEWTMNFKNTGDHDSPMLQDIKSMDLSFPAADKLLLHHHTGDYAAEDSYEPHETEIIAGSQLHFAPENGRPTDKGWPYFNIENTTEKSGLIAVVGWPGQWSADMVRSTSEPQTLHLSAGQELTHFVLHPGEEARTPISVVMFYDGDSVDGQNLWRRWMLEENIPHPNGQLPIHVNASAMGLHQSEKSETDGIRLFASHGANLNYWWMDAGWYPCKNWWDGVGTWKPDPVRFPRGVKAVSDVAHVNGLKLILWIEPERAVPGTELYTTHPEFLLGKDGGEKLLDLGNPAAWAWIVNRVDQIITTQGVDLYRQDFNEPALPFWRTNDAADRQGITEMRHVEGYLRFWDELHRRHPNLLIDTCSSGGRRLDLETLRRSVPLWRSDDSDNPEHNQCQTYGIASWIPMYGSGTACDTAYTIRSEMLPFFTLGMPTGDKPMDWDLYHREAANWAAIKDDFLGDYYPLLPYSRDLHSWIAWQFDRPDQHQGVVQVFRRPDSPYESATFKLHALDPAASYRVTNLDTPGESQTRSGEQLMSNGLKVAMDSAPAATIVTYAEQR